LEFILFALVLIGIAAFHRHAMAIALIGLAATAAWKAGHGFALLPHLREEAKLLLNLFGLLLGFVALARHFAASRLPEWLPRLLPDDWKGPFLLLVLVFLLSTFLDNIAAALVGGTVAASVFRGRVRVGYLAALVAASNAGGAGSVLGDTTTTMLWIAGHPASGILRAGAGAVVALLLSGIPAALSQHRHQAIQADPAPGLRVRASRLAAVVLVLAGAVAANLAWDFPAAGVWAALLLCAPWAGLPRGVLPGAARGAIFLCALVLLASLMPVERLPAASWPTTLALGFVSSVFDNIPLTRLALAQGGYDWGLLAYAVGFGGSMLWFGSSAGVALSGEFPEMRSVRRWLKEGWVLIPAYVVGFCVQGWAFGWVQ
jgi:hypothetical protein